MSGLLISTRLNGEVALVIGNSPITWSRIKKILECDPLRVVIVGRGIATSSHTAQYEELQKSGKLVFIDREVQISDLTSLGREEVDNVVDFVFACDASDPTSIYQHCRRLRIPINTTDRPDLCTFTLLSSHTDGNFQLGITTNGQGCRLANRLKRHVVNELPSNVGEICSKVGELRQRIQKEDCLSPAFGENEDDAEQGANFNHLVSEESPSAEQKKTRRARWLSQLVEYYPLEKLASIPLDDMVQGFVSNGLVPQESESASWIKFADKQPAKRGIISLVGAGPGHASFLTSGAVNEINTADLVLADKLVPSQVLELIPKHTEVFIARKFPGNAEKAQEELLDIGLQALKQGRKVVRLKQGDPYIFGRGGEEFNFFKQQGFQPIVLPGITSALAATLLANIPSTHRDVADQLLVCTGTGRKGVLPNLPEWVPTRTTVILMGLHRIFELVKGLTDKHWPVDVACCIVERASCPDQRIIRSSLQNVAQAIEACGSRPPGLLIVGHSCRVIETQFDVAQPWTVEEGFSM